MTSRPKKRHEGAWYQCVILLPRQPKETHGSPFRAQACEPYQNLDEGRSLPGVNYILPYREGLVRWLSSLVLSFAPKERTDLSYYQPRCCLSVRSSSAR